MARDVVREDRQANAVQAQPLEGMLEHQLGRLGAQAATPGVALADRDVEQHRAVVAVERAERREADQPPIGQLDDASRRARRAPACAAGRSARPPPRSSAAPGSASGGRSRGRGTSARPTADPRAAGGAARPAGRRSAAGARSRGRGNELASCWGTAAIVYHGYHRARCAAGARSRPESPPRHARARRSPPWPSTCAR